MRPEVALAALLGVLVPARLAAQPPPSSSPTGAAPEKKDARPGRYRVGPFYFTPRFHFGPIGLDSNVLYTATDRQADVMVSLGPGLDSVLPLGGAGRFYLGGTLDYLYFVRTASQRRFTGSGFSGLAFKGAQTETGVEERYVDSFSRPNYQVDERIEQQNEKTTGFVNRHLFSRLRLGLRGGRESNRTESVDYLGTNLGAAFTYDEYRAEGTFAWDLTVKSAFVVEGGFRWDRYPQDPVRDSERRLAAAGFRTDKAALLAGHALVGLRWYRQDVPQASQLQSVYADVNETLNLSPRTRVVFTYSRDLLDSVFVPGSGTPTNQTAAMGLRLEKDITRRIDLVLFARRGRSLSNGEITIDVPDQGLVTAVRDDKVREAGADLGYRIRPNFRFGLIALYSDRQSSFSYFGVEGLLFGFNAQFNP